MAERESKMKDKQKKKNPIKNSNVGLVLHNEELRARATWQKLGRKENKKKVEMTTSAMKGKSQRKQCM